MRRSEDSKIARLGEVYLFRQCTRKELTQLAKILDEVDFKTGDVLCEEGRTAHECFLVIEGTADVLVGDRKVASVAPGESVGEMGLLNHLPRSATVVATSPLSAYVIEGQRFSALLEDVPSLAKALLQQLSMEVRNLDRALASYDQPAPTS